MQLKETYEGYVQYLKTKGMSEKTIVEHKRFLYGSLSHSIQDKEIDDLRVTDISFVIEAGRLHGTTGAQRSVCVFRRLLKYIKDSGIKLPIDWRDLEVPKIPQKPVEYLTPEELQLIRDSLDIENLQGLRTRALIEVLLDTGMRISEACSLNKDDIDWEKKEAKIINAKSKDQEMVYFTERSLWWLQKYWEMRKDVLPFAFVSGRGRLLTISARNYLAAHTKHLGIRKHIRHHIFRRTFATWLIKGGVNIKEVQTLCRHRSERTTLRSYVGFNQEQAKDSHQQVFSCVI